MATNGSLLRLLLRVSLVPESMFPARDLSVSLSLGRFPTSLDRFLMSLRMCSSTSLHTLGVEDGDGFLTFALGGMSDALLAARSFLILFWRWSFFSDLSDLGRPKLLFGGATSTSVSW